MQPYSWYSSFSQKLKFNIEKISDDNWSEPIDICEEGMVSRFIEYKGSASQVLVEVKALNGVHRQVRQPVSSFGVTI
jgi:hypothetical protein